MKRKKKVEISELFNGELVLERHNCFNPNLETLYYDYYNNRNIELCYHKKNLLKYINEQKNTILKQNKDEDTLKKIEKEINRKFVRKYLLYAFIPLSLFTCHVAGKNYVKHEVSNIKNTYAVINNFAQDENEDAIIEINTDVLSEVDGFFMPTDDPYYKNSNFLYDLCDETRILDNISFMYVLNDLGYDTIEIDGIKYSKTGKITDIHYRFSEKDDEICMISTSKTFNNNDEIKEFLNDVFKSVPIEKNFIIENYNTYEVEKFDSIPNIMKSKEDGSINNKKPSKTLTKIVKKIAKEYDTPLE